MLSQTCPRLFKAPVTYVILLLAAQAGLLACGAVVHSPSIDEVGHLPAGIGIWQQGR